MATTKPDVTLSTGTVVTHTPMANGAWEASEMTAAEWGEYCELARQNSYVAPGSAAAQRALEVAARLEAEAHEIFTGRHTARYAKGIYTRDQMVRYVGSERIVLRNPNVQLSQDDTHWIVAY